MQLVVRVASDHVSAGASIIDRVLSGVLPQRARARTRVEAVFPGVSSGRRAGLFTIDLPAEVTPDHIEPLLRALREEQRVEYAETTEPKRSL